MSLSTRFSLAFRVLFDGAFAARLQELSEPKALPEPKAPSSKGPGAVDGALQLLSLLQREGRLVDFLQQDITSYADGDVGAAARVVHEGCRKALRAHGSVHSIRSESEGASITVADSEAELVKLTGNVTGSAPYRGVLRHRGWRVENFKLPTLVGERDLSVVAPAEVEL
ncbi:MAG TPA: DUF2760 domain-containing protein [Polyangiaceae bacterium]|nr:DUF2760 domain-containing protein [Polyangiaceae bacterium]